MKTHHLKTWPLYFTAIREGRKLFEIRKDDRGFGARDRLLLKEWGRFDGAEKPCCYSGREILVRVTCITGFDQQPGYVVMGIAPVGVNLRPVQLFRLPLKRRRKSGSLETANREETP